MIYMCVYIYIYICIYYGGNSQCMVAIFCPFGLFCEIDSSLLSLQEQPNTAPNLFHGG